MSAYVTRADGRPVCALAPAAAPRRGHGGDVGRQDRQCGRVRRSRARHARRGPSDCDKGTARARSSGCPRRWTRGRCAARSREAAEVIGLATEQVNEQRGRRPTRPRARGATARQDPGRHHGNEARKAAIADRAGRRGRVRQRVPATLSEEMRNPSPTPPPWGEDPRTRCARGGRRSTRSGASWTSRCGPAAACGQAPRARSRRPAARASARIEPLRSWSGAARWRRSRRLSRTCPRRQLAARIRCRRRAARPRQDRPSGRPPDRGRA